MESEEVNESEQKLRKWLVFGYRYAWAVFLSWQMFDFLFSPIWMHGYLWSLNLPIDNDFSDKSAGYIIDHQLRRVGRKERLFDSFLVVSFTILILKLIGYAERNFTVWELLRISMILGAFASLARCTQTKQRLFTVLHDVFFIYFNIFTTGLIMTMHLPEKEQKEEQEGKELEDELFTLSSHNQEETEEDAEVKEQNEEQLKLNDQVIKQNLKATAFNKSSIRKRSVVSG
ncbi:unnamed protein product [Bursaphelenchus okinawaensis]|uniref:Uncharacterized protein n=1 Tax=Bursaphelenchus okinawaensis TaxID=465554 RepID=A0A811LTM2_9BILA|nr:unnamed protein product [Bursaphelenchus okinawaensis]CAG9127732.1 unnamed protein product [Bursaphelenchus okinawaensis]